MKKVIFFIAILLWGQVGFVFAQSPLTIGNNFIGIPTASSASTCNTASNKGKLYFNTIDNKMYYCNGSAWEALLTDSPWLANGTHINNGNTGNVGIGIVTPTQKLDVVGSIKLTGEVNRPSTGTNNLVPIAYGSILDNDIILTGTGNFTLTNLGAGFKRITVTGVTLSQLTHTIIGSNSSNFPAFVTCQIIGGNLEVSTYTSGGTQQNIRFQFVIYSE